jgi:hypothetical protein
MAGPTFGATGLKVQSVAEIKAELEQDYRDEFGPTHNVADDSLSGKEIGIYSEREALLQEGIQFVYSSNYRSTSQGVNLDYNLEITGHARQGATNSTVIGYVRGTSGQSITAEALKVTVDNTGDIFLNPSAGTIGTLGSKSVTSITQTLGLATVTISGGHPYTNGSFVFIEGAEQSGYNLLTDISGVTATTFDYVVDPGTVSPATGSITVYEASPIPLESQETGPIVALAGTLKNISGSVPGVVRVENAVDATEGINTETDPEARARADATVSIAGGGFREAIIDKLLNVSGVTTATLFSNVSNVTDSDGRPPGSVECFVSGGTDADVADGVYNSVSDGVQTYGNVTEIITDSQGQNVTIKFSRLSQVRIYVDVTLTTNTDIAQGPVYPAGGDTQVKAALALIEFDAGQDVWSATLKNAITSAVPGITEITSIKFDSTTPPVNTASIDISPTNFANIDSTDVTVTST